MTEPVKFMFDLNLDPHDGADAEPDSITLEEHEQRLEEARRSAHAEGVAAGLQQAAQEADSRFAASAPALETAICRHFETIDAAIDDNTHAAAELALATARALAPSLVARMPLAEIEALIAECTGHLRSVPHLVIRVNAKMVDAAQKRLDPLIKAAGYEGRLVILGESDIGVGDCRIEWAEGTIVRDLSGLDRVVRDKVTQYVATLTAKRKEKADG